MFSVSNVDNFTDNVDVFFFSCLASCFFLREGGICVVTEN